MQWRTVSTRTAVLWALLVLGCTIAAAALPRARDVMQTAGVVARLGPALRWTPQVSGVTARLRGVSAVSEQVAWASGADGTIVRTVDAGQTWTAMKIPETEKLDFRDVDAFSADVAYALSIGPGEASRIYTTTDGGRRWTTSFVNREPKAFFDAMSFWTAERGVAVSDSVDGQFVILLTRDGGRTWTRASAAGLPPALPNEGAFAASGSNIAVAGTDHVWIGTGASATARVLRSSDAGQTWTVSSTPIPAGPSAGIFSIAFRDTQHGVIVGGDYKREGDAIDNVAITNDGGVTWTLVKPPRALSGFRSAVAFLTPLTPPTPPTPPAPPTPPTPPTPRTPVTRPAVPASVPLSERPQRAFGALLAVGPSGSDYSADDGRSWQAIEGPGFHAFSVARDGRAAWAVGEQGRIARLDGLTSSR